MYFFPLGVASANSIAFLQFEVLHCSAAPSGAKGCGEAKGSSANGPKGWFCHAKKPCIQKILI